MTAYSSVDYKNETWNTFDKLRSHLENQYEESEYLPETGLSISQLNQAVNEYLSTSKDSFVVQKANVFKIIVTKGQIAVDPGDWFADKLRHGRILERLKNRYFNEVMTDKLPYHSSYARQAQRTGYFQADLDLGHISPGWSFLLENGLSGLLKISEECRNNLSGTITPEQTDFYDAVKIVYTSAIELSRRYAKQAEAMAHLASNPQHSTRLKTIASVSSNVPENPPKTFHEALQFIYLMHQLIEMEGEAVRSMGGFDRLLYPYYKADIDSGILTRDQAKELIKFFWTKFFAVTKGVANGKNFYFGGQLPNGENAVNELTYVALEAYEELKTTDPKLSVRFSKNTPKEFLKRVAEIIVSGQTSFVLTNDDITVPAMMKRGKTQEEAYSHLLIGCYEPTVEGKEAACNMSIKINLAKGIELALNNGIDPVTRIRLGPQTGNPADFKSYEDFFSAYLTQTDYQLTRAMDCIKEFELYWPEINPSPFIAGTFIDCLRNGRDIGQGGAKYNSTGCMGASLANAADSLLAIKTLVFDEQKCTFPELIKTLKSDYENDEQLRLYILNRIPKWGNNIKESDDIAVKIAEFYTNKVNHSKNNRGGYFQASMFTLDYRFGFGRATGALPDGRKSGVHLAPSINAMTGMDKAGVTGLINSITKLDFTNIPNGSVMDINLHPTAVKGEEGLNAFISLIQTYFDKGGFAVQFNIFDTKTLLDAQKHPENYATLQIRVTGWNVYFVSLSAEAQNQFINENKHMM